MTQTEDDVEAAMSDAMVPMGRREKVRRPGSPSGDRIEVVFNGSVSHLFVGEMESRGYDFKAVHAAHVKDEASYGSDRKPVVVFTFHD